MLNSKQPNKNLYKLNLDTNDSNKKLSELKINSIFQKINDALISDFNNLDHSFKLTKLSTSNVFKNKKIFDDPYWGMKISSISYGIKKYGDMNKSLDLIKNKSLDVLFRKLIFYFKTRELAKADKLYNLLIAHNNHDFIFAEEQRVGLSENCKLYLQPEWSVRDKMLPLIIDYVMKHSDWRISLQTHKYLNIP